MELTVKKVEMFREKDFSSQSGENFFRAVDGEIIQRKFQNFIFLAIASLMEIVFSYKLIIKSKRNAEDNNFYSQKWLLFLLLMKDAC